MNNSIDFLKIKKIYCIGIGGIGLSAVARYFLHNASQVAGSDVAKNTLVIDLLEMDGVKKIYEGHKKENLLEYFEEELQKEKFENNFESCLVVYTIAIDKENNEEYLEAQRLGIKCLSYPEALGEITKKYKTISVCGTHGKTTTTAMTYFALKEAGINASVIVGSLITDEFGKQTNFINGDSEYLVVESCEYKRSFLNLHPTYILITNVDADHLDYYKDLNDIKSAFDEFKNKKSVLKVFEHNINLEKSFEEIDLSVLGKHNKENAKLVLMLGEYLGLDENKLRAGLKKFKGTWRRMEYKGTKPLSLITGSSPIGGEQNTSEKSLFIYDDYGHHPTEIKATLEAMREKYINENLIVVFQPHLYSRTKIFLKEFAESFDLADKVFILPIYAAREKFDESVSSEMLCEKVAENDKATFVKDFQEAKDKVLEYILNINNLDYNNKKDFVLLTIGAGEAYKVGNLILEK